MRKKVLLILGIIIFSLGLTSYLLFNDNGKEDNKVSNTNNVKKILKMPHNIQAYTLNGERTDKTFDEMVNYYVIDTITCQNGSVATYNQSDNTVTMTNVHVPEYCVMNFKPGTYTLTIDPNGGYRASDNDSSIMKVNYQYGHVESITERKKDGYTLIGYEMFNTDTGSADDVKGSKFEFDSSTNIGTFTQGAANITLKATWGTNTYKVTLDNQGATTAGTAEVYYQYNTTNTINGVTCYYYTDVTLKSCVTNGTTITVPTKAGYTFDGYYTEVNGGGTQYVNASGTFINNIYKTTGSKTLYAKWTANKYKLTLTKGTGIGTIFYKINGASAYTSATATTTLDVNYDSTYYYYGVALTGYTYTKCTESSPCSAKMGAEAASQTLTGTISKYKLTLTKGTGIGTIYYKINGASTYTSTTATATLNVNYGSTYYYYGVASTGYTYTACTASSPCSGKMGTTAVSQTLTGTINTYKVTLTVSGGAGSTSKNINYNSSGTFTGVKPNSGYTATGATLTCNGGATIGLSGTTVTVSKVTKTQTCTVTFKKAGTVLANLIKSYATSHTNGVYNENGYRYEGSNPSNYIYMTNKSTNTNELWRIIGVFNDGENGEEVIRVRRHYEQGSYPTMAYDEMRTNHFPRTTMYNTLSSTYNLTNYNHTVNFKMYLGTSSSPNSLTSSGIYSMERGNTPGKTAAIDFDRSTSFIGSIGLIYPSDYGYAVLASDCPRSTATYNYSGTTACHDNNWLYQGNGKDQWLISPSASSTDKAFFVQNGGSVKNYISGLNAMAYSPVMALSKDVLVAGSGTKTDPYRTNLETGTVVFHRNQSASDTTTVSQTFTLGATGNRFGYNNNGTPKWTQSGQFGKWDYSGHTLIGWALTKNATTANYSIYSNVSDNWLDNVINKKYSTQTTAGTIDLYAVWEKNS